MAADAAMIPDHIVHRSIHGGQFFRICRQRCFRRAFRPLKASPAKKILSSSLPFVSDDDCQRRRLSGTLKPCDQTLEKTLSAAEPSSLPDFDLPLTGGGTFSPATLAGKKTILYFYPKDNTPGCTNESIDFRDSHADFIAAGYMVYGISRDSLKSHQKFQEKYALPFELVADVDEVLCNAFGVMKMKNMYGRQVRGIERSTFLLDDGRTVREWRRVKVPGHVSEVLQSIRQNG